MDRSISAWLRRLAPLGGCLAIWGVALHALPSYGKDPAQGEGGYVLVAYNDLGMHCMNEDFSQLCILPPANTVRTTVLRRGSSPELVQDGLVANYNIPGNTRSDNKTNFWQYAPALFGAMLPLNVGLTGNRLAGTMQGTGAGEWVATFIPVTPRTDQGKINPYQLIHIDVLQNGNSIGTTDTVIPVSWEISCDMCHSSRNRTVATDILLKHDKKFGTRLNGPKPVLCAKCHSDNALGAPGQVGVSSMSRAMHKSHDSRMGQIRLANKCYACHPGVQTKCMRGVHDSKGMVCTDCHGGMAEVADPARRPWLDEPRCGSCHTVPGHEYEQPGTLYRESVGHNGVKCYVCHGSPHAILPSRVAADNVQSIRLQGFDGTLRKCTVCHTQTPSDPFNHTRRGD